MQCAIQSTKLYTLTAEITVHLVKLFLPPGMQQMFFPCSRFVFKRILHLTQLIDHQKLTRTFLNESFYFCKVWFLTVFVNFWAL